MHVRTLRNIPHSLAVATAAVVAAAGCAVEPGGDLASTGAALSAAIPSCALSTDAAVSAYQTELSATYEQTLELGERIDTWTARATEAKRRVDLARDVAAKIVAAKEQLDKARTMIAVLKPLPIVGGAASTADNLLRAMQIPVDRAYPVASRAKPRLESASARLDALRRQLEAARDRLDGLERAIDVDDRLVCFADGCAPAGARALADSRAVVAAVRDALSRANGALEEVERYLDGAEAVLAGVRDDLARRVDDVLSAIARLLGPIGDLYDALDVRVCANLGFTQICANVIDVLRTVRQLLGLVEGLLDPLVDALLAQIRALTGFSPPSFDLPSGLVDLPDPPDLGWLALPEPWRPDPCPIVADLGACVPADVAGALGCPSVARGGTCATDAECTTGHCSAASHRCYDPALSLGAGATCYDSAECAATCAVSGAYGTCRSASGGGGRPPRPMRW